MKKLGVLGLSLLLCLGVVKASFAALTADDTVSIMVVVVSDDIAINIVNVDTNLFSVKTGQSTVSAWDKRIIVKNIGVAAADWSLQAENFDNDKLPADPAYAAYTLQESGDPGSLIVGDKCRLMGIFIPYVLEADWNYALTDFDVSDIIKSTADTYCDNTNVFARPVAGDDGFRGSNVGIGINGERTLCLGFDAPPLGTTTGIGEEMFSTLTITAIAYPHP